MNRYATQGRLLIEAIRNRPMTYQEMLKVGISTAPWKRVAESLGPQERISKGVRVVGGRSLVTWRVVRA
jgi:hypothetical protein